VEKTAWLKKKKFIMGLANKKVKKFEELAQFFQNKQQIIEKRMKFIFTQGKL